MTLQKRLKAVYDRTAAGVQKALAASPYVALCADGWSDANHGEFIGVTAVPLLSKRVPYLISFSHAFAHQCQTRFFRSRCMAASLWMADLLPRTWAPIWLP